MMLLKTLHIVFMTAWFAGLFYLPRLFVYHSMSNDKISLDRFLIMERKLLNGIMLPSAILTIASGFSIIYFYIPSYFYQTWLLLKIFSVFVLLMYHFWCFKIYINFLNKKNSHNHIWYRWFNEFPVVMLIFIVYLVIYKPNF